MPKYVRVVETYQATYRDPIIVRAGEHLNVGDPDPEQPDWFWCEGPDGRVGWVPRDCIADGLSQYDYSAVELSAKESEELVLLREAYGWAFCQRANGELGWIPLKNLSNAPM